MRLIGEAFGLVFGLAIILWVVAIYSADQEKKAVVMCRPVHYLVNGAGYLTVATTGKSPAEGESFPWQDSVRLNCLKAMDRLVAASSK
jgi:hypothetical protein